jgi:sortase A
LAHEVAAVIRRLGTLIMLLGLGLLAWCATVYFWKDPFTTAYTAWQQRELASGLDRRISEWRELHPPPTPLQTDPAAVPLDPARARRQARAYRDASSEGDAVARLKVPRLGVNVIVVNGTEADDLRKGPGRHMETYMPGERELVYIAGHRTTYGAPFSDIDDLRAGDRVVVELPYGTFEYRVTGHRIVDQYELSVLKTRHREELALQACHPRFFASQRYIVYARPVRALAPTS